MEFMGIVCVFFFRAFLGEIYGIHGNSVHVFFVFSKDKFAEVTSFHSPRWKDVFFKLCNVARSKSTQKTAV